MADNGSGPDTVELVKSFALAAPFPLHHVWREDRGGIGFQRLRNERIKKFSLGEVSVFFDV